LRITDLWVERDIAAAATPGPWFIDAPDHLYVGNRGDGRAYGLWEIVYSTGDVMPDLVPEAQSRAHANATHIATQDPATTIARIDRELAGCAADLALLDEWLGVKIVPTVESLTLEGMVRAVTANLEARYPSEESS
jgi:hypothetical protein